MIDLSVLCGLILLMKVEIVANNDENFNIEVKKFGEQFVATDGERVVIGTTETDALDGVVELQEQNKAVEETVERGPKPVPIENVRTSNSQSWFSGTSWDTSTGHKF